jgi:hypothetical protein
LEEPSETVQKIKDASLNDNTVDIKYVNIKDVSQIKDHDVKVNFLQNN